MTEKNVTNKIMTKRKATKTEKFLIFISLTIFVMSASAIFGYEYLFRLKEDKQVIARVESASNDSLIKAPDGHEYKQLKENDPITNGDNLLSGKGSKILVKFINGPRIVIGEESTLSIRQIDGQPDLRIEKGSFSGSFEEGDVLDVLTQNEVITLSGEKDTQFSVAHAEGGEVEIGSFDGNLGVEYKGEKFQLNKERASISKRGRFKPLRSTSQPSKKTTTADQNKNSETTGISEATLETSKAAQNAALSAPFPQENHIFLHKTGGKILVYPQAQCKGACELEISLEGKNKIKKVFARDMVPLMYLKVESGTQAKVNWKFSDGGEDLVGNFEILINNSENFQKAVDKKLPVEVLN